MKLANVIGVIALLQSPSLVVRLGWYVGPFSRLYHQKKKTKTKFFGENKFGLELLNV